MRTVKRLALAGILGSGFLALLNVTVGLYGGSTSVAAVGIEFAGDVMASGAVLLGSMLAARPADQDHPYGHGRIETLAGLLVGLILVFGGAGICFRSLQKVAEVHPPPAAYAVYPLAVSIFVKTILSTLKFHYGRKVRSAALVADAWNDAVDILASMAAMIAVLFTLSDPVRFLSADHYGGFTVGLVVIYTGIRVIRDTSLELIDTMPSPVVLDDIRSSALGVSGVWGVEKVFARKTGLQYHVDLHLEVDPEISVRASHEIAHNVRQHVLDTLGSVADVLIHVEPGRERAR